MPLTFAHPLVAVPLRRLGLPLAALAVGSMTPDLVLFAHVGADYSTTHSLLGVVTVDVVLGAVILAIWQLGMRRPLTDGAPDAIRARLPRPPRVRDALAATGPGLGRRLLLVTTALVLGALTHVAWDAFTHSHGTVVRRVAALQRDAGLLPVYEWLQYASSLVGVAGLAILTALALARRMPEPAPREHRVAGPLALYGPLAVGALCAGVVIGAGIGAMHVLELIYVLAFLTIRVTGIAVILGCLVWWACELIRPGSQKPGISTSTSTGR